ncbi:MAG TPA: hypothetical protein DCP28_38490, partial [Cytophagales bacterium]|nr:hypothetical protein [Cytophagales bacterium]
DKATLWAGIQQVVAEAKEVIGRMTPEQMMERRSVQGFDYTGVANVVHVVEHFSYHVGQMVFWVKLLKDKDLAFYGGIDLNAKNE